MVIPKIEERPPVAPARIEADKKAGPLIKGQR